MTAVLRQEILAYLDRVDWKELIQSRLQNWDAPPSDSVYSNEEARINEAKAKGSSSDHIRFGLGKDEKSKLLKVCNLRNIVMSALIRLMITRYVNKGEKISKISQLKVDFTDSRTKDFLCFNLPIKVGRDFKKACDKYGVSQSRVLRVLLNQYLERVQWSKGLKPLNDDPEFPVDQIKEEELVGEFKFTHIVVDKASKNKFELACRGRGVRPSSLFRLMIARFIQNPLAFNELESENHDAGRTALWFSCPEDLFNLFSEYCAQQMLSPEGLIKQMLLDYLGRVDMNEIRRNRKKGGEPISSDLEFPNEEVSQEDSGSEKLFSVHLTKAQKSHLNTVCKARKIDPSALVRVMLGRSVMTATLAKAD